MLKASADRNQSTVEYESENKGFSEAFVMNGYKETIFMKQMKSEKHMI